MKSALMGITLLILSIALLKTTYNVRELQEDVDEIRKTQTYLVYDTSFIIQVTNLNDTIKVLKVYQ